MLHLSNNSWTLNLTIYRRSLHPLFFFPIVWHRETTMLAHIRFKTHTVSQTLSPGSLSKFAGSTSFALLLSTKDDGYTWANDNCTSHFPLLGFTTTNKPVPWSCHMSATTLRYFWQFYFWQYSCIPSAKSCFNKGANVHKLKPPRVFDPSALPNVLWPSHSYDIPCDRHLCSCLYLTAH